MTKIWMNRRRVMAAAASMAMAMALSGCGKTDRMRYRMTVEVETREGIKTGSAVREVMHFVPRAMPSLGENRPYWEARGEAVAVDLPGGQTLFALLPNAAGDPNFPGWGIWWLFKQIGGRAIELWPNEPVTRSPIIASPRPLLVRFGDIRNPASVAAVNPADLAASYGEGVKLRRIVVELTDDAVTSGIQRRLGWLERTNGALVHIPVDDYPPIGTPLPLSATLTELEFKVGESR